MDRRPWRLDTGLESFVQIDRRFVFVILDGVP
jgi:hypothetical protein